MEFLDDAAKWCNTGAPDVRSYLDPKPGMRFLEVGCSASLLSHGLGKWASTYYGVDISHALIAAMKQYTQRSCLPIGGLYVAESARLPFASGSIDIAALIGVLEYCTNDYVRQTVSELSRVLRSGSRVVFDIPNLDHPHSGMMFEMEQHLGRPQYRHDRKEFEGMLATQFCLEHVDESRVMLKYFCRAL